MPQEVLLFGLSIYLSRDIAAIALRLARAGKGLLLTPLTSAVYVICRETIVWGNAFYLKNKSSENFPTPPIITPFLTTHLQNKSKYSTNPLIKLISSLFFLLEAILLLVYRWPSHKGFVCVWGGYLNTINK